MKDYNLEPTLEDEKKYLLDRNLKLTTKEIEEITGKLHKNILRDLRKQEKALGSKMSRLKCKVEWTTAKDAKGRDNPIAILDRNSASILLAGYSIAHRIEIVAYFNRLEDALEEKAVDNIQAAMKEEQELRELTASLMNHDYSNDDAYDEETEEELYL